MREAYQSKDNEKIAAIKSRQMALNNLAEEQRKEYQQSKLNYVKEHPDSPISPYVLGFQFSEGRMDKETLKEVYHTFQGAAKKTAMFAYYEKTYTEIFESLGIGAKAPDFTLKTLQETNLRLSDVKGKIILLDFWASWCVPCRKSFPFLKKQYTKYKKDGFEVVAVATADIGEKWRKAIKVDETNWIHVFDGDANLMTDSKTAPFGEVSKLYGVPFLPTTFLLDENLKILGRNLTKEELNQKLEEIFGY